MDNAIRSRHFARDVAKILGLPVKESAPGSPDQASPDESEQLLAEMTDTFRYLPGEQINQAFAFARFLVADAGDRQEGRRSPRWPIAKLREILDFLLFLRNRYGTALPADESTEWSDEDLRDLAVACIRTWDEREAMGEA